jgi:hypothetical protein
MACHAHKGTASCALQCSIQQTEKIFSKDYSCHLAAKFYKTPAGQKKGQDYESHGIAAPH